MIISYIFVAAAIYKNEKWEKFTKMKSENILQKLKLKLKVKVKVKVKKKKYKNEN